MNLKKNLHNKYVAFLDVLGFKELVSRRRVDTLETYFTTISETLTVIRNDKKNIKSLLVSDSIILVSPDTTEDFKTLLRAIQTIQARLSLKNIWIRGAISFGEIYYNEISNIIVGKGLINSYLLEREAKYPRVIVDTAIIPKIAENRQTFYETVNPSYKDFETDKLKLIHSWHKYIPEDSFFVAYGHRIILDAVRDRNLYSIHSLVLKNLYADQRNYDKYLWVRNYFMDIMRDLADRWNSLKSQQHKEDRMYLEKWWGKFTEI